MNTNELDKLLKANEENVRKICSPFRGNCFEIAYALNQIFSSQVYYFCSIYAEPQFVDRPKILPLHITVNINGTLFDAGGKLDETQLLSEFAPVQDIELIEQENTFLYEEVISEELVNQITQVYKKDM